VKFFEGTTERVAEGIKIWPKVVQPGQMASITAKGMNNGFRLNDQIRIVVQTASGATLQQTFTNTHSPFRISNIIPSPDYSHLWIYFRNDDSLPREMGELFVNGSLYNLAGADKSMIVGEDNVVRPRHVAIVKYTQSQPMKQLMNIHLAVQSYRTGGAPGITSAAVRLVNPVFPIGTWHSSGLNPENEQGRKNMRELMITSIHGPGNTSLMAKGYKDYFIRTIWEPGFGDPFNPANAVNDIRNNAGKPFINVWSCDDEPDLNDKIISEQSVKNMTYWENDTIIPTYVNLAIMRKYNRYGWYSDVVGMDHYAAPTAPNILPLTWVPVVGRNGELQEALEYSEWLKFNSEPRRNWSWVQFAPGPWSQEPTDFTINIQFWMHILGGAKGMEFFVAQSGTKNNWPAQWEVGRQCVKQLAAIRNVIMEGEYANIVDRGTLNVVTRALVGPEAMMIGVINNTTRFTWNGSFDPIRYNAAITPVNYTVEFDMPSWITPTEVYKVGPEGEKLTNVNLQPLGNGRWRISSTEQVSRQSHIFIISSKNDTKQPEPPIGLQRVDIRDSSNFTLSWDVPFDNYGIQSYDIFRNGQFYKNVGVPILEVSDGYLPCPEVTWEAVAIDPSGNRSQPTILKVSQQVSVSAPDITDITPDLTVNEGEAAIFTLTLEGAFESYTWQYNDGSGWKNASDIPAFIGANTSSLSIAIALKAYDSWQFRCIGNTLCFGKDTSNTSLLTVRTSTGTKDPLLAGVEVFPNPASELIRIRFPENHAFNRIGLSDALGRDLDILRVVEGNQESFQLSSLASGTYYIRLMSADKTVLIPFVKQ
jgi:Secretion system C-terminal sorting domain